ncbi:MAG: hypothetical protein KF773_39295 [Deltaproteobacteria bacterium]|nr:hypothetical protein [Deltaproteobacteria bacterium]
MMTRIMLALALVATTACGEDGGGGQQPQPGQQATPAAAAPAAAPGAGSGPKLSPQVHIEDRVGCKAPPAGAKVCDPNALTACDPKSKHYCIATQTQTGIQYLCGPCPERDGIRAAFKESDFALDVNRDPFASVMGESRDAGSAGSAKPVITEECKPDKVVASNYSFQDLTLRGIVAQGTKRKVLMMDSGGLGHIIGLKDCVGKEKAIVKDIGTEYITFQLNVNGTGTKYEDKSVQLHPNRVALSSNPSSSGAESSSTDRPPSSVPIVTPVTPERPTVVIPPTRAPVITPNIPPQAPTTLRP